MLKTECIRKLLEIKTHPDLAALYNPNMEVQVNVAQDGGERIEGEYKGKAWHGWSDGVTTWKPIRIPLKASTEPEYTDSEIKFDLAEHAEAIGMTGWDWKNKVSRWVGFDFDSISGHAKGLTDNELNDIVTAVKNLEWVTVRKSTSGKGLHLYIFLDNVPTNNHTEHAALARSILGLMSALVRTDFQSKIDGCGGNLWVWHRKMKGTDGLTLIKQGGKLLDIPPNWRDHLKVIKGTRRKNLPQEIEEQGKEDLFEQLSGQRPRVQLDSEHKRLLDYLKENNLMWYFDSDNHMVVTHTSNLKQAHQDLSFKGFFETNSPGTNRNEQNCFSGNTEVLTRQGIFEIKELARIGYAELLVKTDLGMEWKVCAIKNFGHQQLWSTLIGDELIYSTANHQWLYIDGREKISKTRCSTNNLRLGKRLPIADRELPEMNMEGYAHGFTFGDGWLANKGKQCDVNLHGHDNDLLPVLLQFGKLGTSKIKGCNTYYTNCVRGLPNTWKELPSNPTKEYALGFILGLFAADGSVIKDTLAITQVNMTVLSEIKRLAQWVGIQTRGMTNIRLHFSSHNLTKKHFLRKDHQNKIISTRKPKAFIVRANQITSKFEEVFCAIVPRFHNFVLANGVITGNCFAYPLPKGAWSVRRFTPGIAEHVSWQQDGAGWTKCFYNIEPDLATACRAYGGLEDPSGGFVFREAEVAIKAASLMGTHISVGTAQLGRKTKIKQAKDGRIILEIEHDPQDRSDEMNGWLVKKGLWTKLFHANTPKITETDTANYDDLVRHLITTSGEDYGWVLKSDGSWIQEPLGHVKVALGSLGVNPKDLNNVIGTSVFRAWRLVNKPFQSEYPGNREWNRKAAQFRFVPSQDDNLKYASWTKILSHCGSGLDDIIATNPWCKINGLKTGADYLMCWLASMFQKPTEPLPYLFFYGNQNCGKSIFHEATSLLMTSGVMRANAALESQSGFNGELEGALLCIVEEINLRANKTAYNRIKDWCTATELLIHAKNQTPYHCQNTTKWVQCGNEHSFCPVFPGDTRITVCHVKDLDPLNLIPKRQLIPLLEKEAPDFMAALLRLEIPESNDRLNVPVLMTSDKATLEEQNKTHLEIFFTEELEPCPGNKIKFSDFFDRFQTWLPSDEVARWSKIRVGRDLPPCYPKGRIRETGQFYLGNLRWRGEHIDPVKPLTIVDGYLC